MSSKFNPSFRTRRPPPQCKKSKPNPSANEHSDQPGSLAGQTMLINWLWREASPAPVFSFGRHEYSVVTPSNTIVSIDEIDADNYAQIVWLWNHVAQTWIVTCDLLIAGVLIATTVNESQVYLGRTPFSLGQTRVETVRVNGPFNTLLSISVTF